jgi:hypothetical protein
MNEKDLCMVQLKNVSYNNSITTFTFGLFSCIILILAHVDCTYFQFFGCYIHTSA